VLIVEILHREDSSMNDKRWEYSFAIGLILASAILYLIHYLVYGDLHHIGIYLMGDIAFVPIEVLLVTLVIHRLLETRDRRQKLEKLNMVIGTFFSAMGTHLLALFSDHDPDLAAVRERLVVTDDWTEEEFSRVTAYLADHPSHVTVEDLDLTALRDFLSRKEDFLLRLIENPALLEHESFTELLRATFHMTEELEKRKDLTACSESDLSHIRGDIERVYGHLIRQWIGYMHYLKGAYPYLFSLAMRTNPFDEEAEVEVG
jgi:uncharacterized membrane protein